MKTPTLAVLMCAHNSEAHISEAIESVLNQTYKDFEFIVVENGGSTDRTWEIIAGYRDSRIKAFRTAISLLSYNLNFGMTQTGASLVARMDSDDVSAPTRLERQLQHFIEYPDTAVLGTAVECFGNGGTRRVTTPLLTNSEIRGSLPFRNPFSHPSVMFRRDIVLHHRGYEYGRYSQDYDLWIRLSRDPSVRFANLKEPLLQYRLHPGQARGSREAYVTMAGLLLREALWRKSLMYWLGTLLAMLKVLFFSSK
ncbi:MAG: glycosyltransferase [Elusimicrobiales bacterium]|nr:glycosyltransferase [Elusimicrobiales bacterium]